MKKVLAAKPLPRSARYNSFPWEKYDAFLSGFVFFVDGVDCRCRVIERIELHNRHDIVAIGSYWPMVECK